jgi:hypothetical protein
MFGTRRDSYRLMASSHNLSVYMIVFIPYQSSNYPGVPECGKDSQISVDPVSERVRVMCPVGL